MTASNYQILSSDSSISLSNDDDITDHTLTPSGDDNLNASKSSILRRISESLNVTELRIKFRDNNKDKANKINDALNITDHRSKRNDDVIIDDKDLSHSSRLSFKDHQTDFNASSSSMGGDGNRNEITTLQKRSMNAVMKKTTSMDELIRSDYHFPFDTKNSEESRLPRRRTVKPCLLTEISQTKDETGNVKRTSKSKMASSKSLESIPTAPRHMPDFDSVGQTSRNAEFNVEDKKSSEFRKHIFLQSSGVKKNSCQGENKVPHESSPNFTSEQRSRNHRSIETVSSTSNHVNDYRGGITKSKSDFPEKEVDTSCSTFDDDEINILDNSPVPEGSTAARELLPNRTSLALRMSKSDSNFKNAFLCLGGDLKVKQSEWPSTTKNAEFRLNGVSPMLRSTITADLLAGSQSMKGRTKSTKLRNFKETNMKKATSMHTSLSDLHRSSSTSKNSVPASTHNASFSSKHLNASISEIRRLPKSNRKGMRRNVTSESEVGKSSNMLDATNCLASRSSNNPTTIDSNSKIKNSRSGSVLNTEFHSSIADFRHPEARESLYHQSLNQNAEFDLSMARSSHSAGPYGNDLLDISMEGISTVKRQSMEADDSLNLLDIKSEHTSRSELPSGSFSNRLNNRLHSSLLINNTSISMDVGQRQVSRSLTFLNASGRNLRFEKDVADNARKFDESVGRQIDRKSTVINVLSLQNLQSNMRKHDSAVNLQAERRTAAVSGGVSLMSKIGNANKEFTAPASQRVASDTSNYSSSPNKLNGTLDESVFGSPSLIPLRIRCSQLFKDSTIKVSLMDSVQVECKHAHSLALIVFVIRCPGCGACREHAKQITELANETDTAVIGIVKEADEDDEVLIDFNEDYFNYPLFEDTNQNLYKFLGDRKINALHFMTTKPKLKKRWAQNGIAHVSRGDYQVQGGVLLFDKFGKLRDKYFENYGDLLDLDILRRSIAAINNNCNEKITVAGGRLTSDSDIIQS